MVKKQNTFNMDKLAFSQGYAYKWDNRDGGRGHGRKPNAAAQSQNDETTESDSSFSMFSLLQAYSRSFGALASCPYKRTRGCGYSPSDPKHKKRPETSSHMGEQAPGNNLTLESQGIVPKEPQPPVAPTDH